MDDESLGAPEAGDDDAVAAAVLEKLRGFIETLDDGERAVLAALLAPGVQQAFAPEPDVVGFTAGAADDPEASVEAWVPHRLPEALASRIRAGSLPITYDPR